MLVPVVFALWTTCGEATERAFDRLSDSEIAQMQQSGPAALVYSTTPPAQCLSWGGWPFFSSEIITSTCSRSIAGVSLRETTIEHFARPCYIERDWEEVTSAQRIFPPPTRPLHCEIVPRNRSNDGHAGWMGVAVGRDGEVLIRCVNPFRGAVPDWILGLRRHPDHAPWIAALSAAAVALLCAMVVILRRDALLALPWRPALLESDGHHHLDDGRRVRHAMVLRPTEILVVLADDPQSAVYRAQDAVTAARTETASSLEEALLRQARRRWAAVLLLSTGACALAVLAHAIR